MKTISPEQRKALEDLSAEGLLKGLPAEVAEKDIHLTDLLRRLSKIEVAHDSFSDRRRDEELIHDDGIKLIFAGGTCLSKAHGLISRMSEDIDIKVVIAPPSRQLRRQAGDRFRLKTLMATVQATLRELEFDIPETIEDRPNPRVRDKHRHSVLNVRYGTTSTHPSSLRPELQLEIIHREPRLETPLLEFGYLHERLAGIPLSDPLSFHCVHVAETLAEKVLSLLRRCAWNWGGFQAGALDPTLVRHIYDVSRIMLHQPEMLDQAAAVFDAIVEQDVEEFRGQNPEFDAAPKPILRRALEAARAHEVLRRQYDERVIPLIFQGETVSYEEAFGPFEAAANRLLA
jgi:hypothetical protein